MKEQAVQGSLLRGLSHVETRVITHRKDFETLFDGFIKMRAITYVLSSTLLHEFFERRSYREIEVIVGENLTESALRQELQDKPIEVMEALASYVENGALRVFVPRRSIHTKLYILEKLGLVRIIQTSANLTKTAQEANQINYAWYVDLPPEDEFVKRVLQDYQTHAKGCSLFMGDLIDLFKDYDKTPRRELINVWVKGEAVYAPTAGAAETLQEISCRCLLTIGKEGVDVVAVKLPEALADRKELERFLKPLRPIATANTVAINPSDFINHVHKTYGIPLMKIDLERLELRLGFKGTILCLSEPLPDPSMVNQGLEHIEKYIHTADLGKSPDPRFAKASMFEALLYIFFSPFASKYMRKKRTAYGQVDLRGPRFLYIYGPAQNGKSTFLRFALKLITGQNLEALSTEEFSKGKITGAVSVGSVFPLVFDDVELSGKKWVPDVLKSYWEIWYREGLDMPQLIMTSNQPKLEDWARSRVKRIDFDVHFAPTEQGKRKLKELFEHENRIFQWFSYLYLQHLLKDSEFSDDELYITRTVMRQLYNYAGRALPEFFLSHPIEKEYDLGRIRWADLLYRRRDARIEREKERLLIRFPDQMQFWEIRRFEGYLPPEVKARQEGHTIIIETPEEFDTWCPASRRRWWPFGRK